MPGIISRFNMPFIWSACMFYLLSVGSPAQAGAILPGFFEADYSLFHQGLKIGEMHRSFHQTGDGYVFYSEFKTTGLISLFRKDHVIEESYWLVHDAEYRPLRYRYRQSGGKKPRTSDIGFDWRQQQITNRVGTTIRHMPTEDGMLDPLLYQLVIMRDLNQGVIPTLYTLVADDGRIKTYHFKYRGRETVDTPAGRFETIKLERHRPDSKRMTLFWCATGADHVPVKLVHVEKDGSKTVAKLTGLKTDFED